MNIEMYISWNILKAEYPLYKTFGSASFSGEAVVLQRRM